MQSVAVGWQVYAITGRALDLGYVGPAQFLPALGLSLVTGHVADRFDRRAIIMVCAAIYAVTSLLLFGRASGVLGGGGALPIYAVLVLFGTARAFHGPASQSLLPH